MRIFIKTLTGKTIELNVNRAETITTVKKKIAHGEGIPLEQLQLFFEGKKLEESFKGKNLEESFEGKNLEKFFGRRSTFERQSKRKRLHHYNIDQGSSLYLPEFYGTGEAEPITDASATKSQLYWKEKARRYDFDEDLYIVDPQSHFHILRQLERDVVQRSEYMRSGGSYSTSRPFNDKWGGESLEGIINSTGEIPKWLKEKIVENGAVYQVRFNSLMWAPFPKSGSPSTVETTSRSSKTLTDTDIRIKPCPSLKCSGIF